MKSIPGLAIAFLLLSSTALSQNATTDKVEKEEMIKLEFMVGEWEGKGWMFGQDRTRHSFDQTENIQFRLDSTIILIEGVGKTDGEIIHNALAIISYDKGKESFVFRSYMSDGRAGEFKAERINDTFVWYPADHTKYVISINEMGQWYEVGEMNREGASFQFFEMTLDKK